MSTWTSDELDRIAGAEELELASVRRDGTLRKPVTIWVVRHGDDLYVRSVNGRTSSWFRSAQARDEAHIQAGGIDKAARSTAAARSRSSAPATASSSSPAKTTGTVPPPTAS